MVANVLLTSFPPFSTLSLQLQSECPIDEETLEPHISAREPILGQLLRNGDIYLDTKTLSLRARVRGGKGGFGSQLRAAGGRMSSQRGTGNQDSCRDLSGRRLSTVKEAKKLAQYIEAEEDRKKAAAEERKQRLEKLERKIAAAEAGTAADEAESSTAPAAAGQKRRLEDTEFVEQSKEIVDSVKSAVAAGLLKKRKKAKTEGKSTPSVVEKILESPATAPIVTAASVSVAVASASA